MRCLDFGKQLLQTIFVTVVLFLIFATLGVLASPANAAPGTADVRAAAIAAFQGDREWHVLDGPAWTAMRSAAQAENEGRVADSTANERLEMTLRVIENTMGREPEKTTPTSGNVRGLAGTPSATAYVAGTVIAVSPASWGSIAMISTKQGPFEFYAVVPYTAYHPNTPVLLFAQLMGFPGDDGSHVAMGYVANVADLVFITNPLLAQFVAAVTSAHVVGPVVASAPMPGGSCRLTVNTAPSAGLLDVKGACGTTWVDQVINKPQPWACTPDTCWSLIKK